MATLMQLMKTQKRSSYKTTGIKVLNEKLSKLRKWYKDGEILGISNDTLDGEAVKLANSLNELARNETWKNRKPLPSEWANKRGIDNKGIRDNLTVLNDLYRVKMADMRDLAEKLNMVIIPIQYTDIDNMFNADKDIGKENLFELFRLFQRLMASDTSREYNTFIMCPVQYYDLWQHIKSVQDFEIYYPPSLAQTFQVLELQIPAQKNMYLMIKANAENISNINANFKVNLEAITNTVKKMATDIDRLEKKVLENEISEKIKKLEEQKEKLIAETRLKEALENRVSYKDYDPIIFALEKEYTINTVAGDAFIGLSWGADIDDATLELKNITVKNASLTSKKINNVLFKNRNTIDELPPIVNESTSMEEVRILFNSHKSTSSVTLVSEAGLLVKMRRYGKIDMDYYLSVNGIEPHYISEQKDVISEINKLCKVNWQKK